ncbi:unnamed protein product [Rotaria sordida]|uniref:Uncharacterized protein n=1 Tax=Rotaria sordida TaxID=392033 RepID=A0A815TLG4_9BILA|nr:unnamed protein product [Rotaria sordida]CAF1657106.1 unnamed protein product [Rotaria sordida]
MPPKRTAANAAIGGGRKESTSSKTPIYVVKEKKTLQDTFIKVNHLDHLGVPQLISHDMHISLTTKYHYRFLIIPYYKQTLANELQLTNNHIDHYLDENRVQSIGKQILDIFEYISELQLFDQLNRENNELRQQIKNNQQENEIKLNQLKQEFDEKRQTNLQSQCEFIQRVSLLY